MIRCAKHWCTLTNTIEDFKTTQKMHTLLQKLQQVRGVTEKMKKEMKKKFLYFFFFHFHNLFIRKKSIRTLVPFLFSLISFALLPSK